MVLFFVIFGISLVFGDEIPQNYFNFLDLVNLQFPIEKIICNGCNLFNDFQISPMECNRPIEGMWSWECQENTRVPSPNPDFYLLVNEDVICNDKIEDSDTTYINPDSCTLHLDISINFNELTVVKFNNPECIGCEYYFPEEISCVLDQDVSWQCTSHIDSFYDIIVHSLNCDEYLKNNDVFITLHSCRLHFELIPNIPEYYLEVGEVIGVYSENIICDGCEVENYFPNQIVKNINDNHLIIPNLPQHYRIIETKFQCPFRVFEEKRYYNLNDCKIFVGLYVQLSSVISLLFEKENIKCEGCEEENFYPKYSCVPDDFETHWKCEEIDSKENYKIIDLRVDCSERTEGDFILKSSCILSMKLVNLKINYYKLSSISFENEEIVDRRRVGIYEQQIICESGCENLVISTVNCYEIFVDVPKKPKKLNCYFSIKNEDIDLYRINGESSITCEGYERENDENIYRNSCSIRFSVREATIAEINQRGLEKRNHVRIIIIISLVIFVLGITISFFCGKLSNSIVPLVILILAIVFGMTKFGGYDLNSVANLDKIL